MRQCGRDRVCRGQAATSSGVTARGAWARVCHPSTLRIVIWPDANKTGHLPSVIFTIRGFHRFHVWYIVAGKK